MKSLLSVFGILAAAASVSSAAVIVNVSKTGTFGSYDEYTITVKGLTGADATTNGAGYPVASDQSASIGTLNMSFDSGSGAVLSIPGTTSTWKGKISNQGTFGENNTPPATYLNMDTVVAATRNGPSSTTSTSTTANFQEADLADGGTGEFRLAPTESSDASNDGFDKTLLGQVYVTSGATFAGITATPGSGQWSIDPGSQAGSYAGTTSFALAPEPATLSLLGLGALSLVARRRRA